MTTESLIKILGDLNQLENVTLEELTALKDQFPYSQNFQVLVAKKKQLLGRDDSDEAFQNLTNYIVNKNHLYERFAESEAEPPNVHTQSSSLDKLIEDELFSGQEQEVEEDISAAIKSIEESDISEDVTENLEFQEEILLNNSSEEPVLEPQIEPEYVSVSDIDDKVVIPANKSIEEVDISDKRNEEEIVEEDELDFITVKPVKLPKNKTVKSKKKKNKTKKPDHKMKSKKKKEKAEKKKKKAIKSSEKDRKKIAKEKKKNLKKEREEKAKEVFTENLDSFTTWLASLSPAKKVDFEPVYDVKETSESNKNTSNPEVKVKKKKKKSKKKKKKLQNKIDSSQQRKSVVVSETLAEIMANQGHIKQSIDIYKQLMLLYPEKSGYFASQIKKLD